VNFLFDLTRQSEHGHSKFLKVGEHTVTLEYVPHRKARRYVLRLKRDGSARVTIPRGGSRGAATEFVLKNLQWLERQLIRQASLPAHPEIWQVGSEILFRGERVRVEAALISGLTLVRFGGESIPVRTPQGDLRPLIERHLWGLATRELPPRVFELAASHQLAAKRVTVRNQRSRWGSCSRKGTISLNWRLVQAPAFVRDYIIIHELAHLLHMNHSQSYWRTVAKMDPNYMQAERWLKTHVLLQR
jgi:predicted metal-dependent hydrolase